MPTLTLDEHEVTAIRKRFGSFLAGVSTTDNDLLLIPEINMHQDSHHDTHQDAHQDSGC